MKTSAAKAYRRPSPAILPLGASIGCAQAWNAATASGQAGGINTGVDV